MVLVAGGLDCGITCLPGVGLPPVVLDRLRTAPREPGPSGSRL